MDKTAMYKLGYGLYVLTAKDGEQNNGCIINTMLQVTSNPLTAIIVVNKQNYTHDIIKKTRECNVSVLTTKAPFDLYKHFGFQSGRDVNKFSEFNNCEYAENGITFIPKFTNAYFCLKVIDEKDLGSHTLFYVDIVDAHDLSKDESVTYAYYQSNVKPKPEEKKTTQTVWRCKVCGYEYVGETLPADFVCPICKHGASDFEKV